MVRPSASSARSTSFAAAWRALKSCICTRLCTLTAPSPLVSIGRKIPSGKSSVISDCTPSETAPEGMQPNGFTLRVMFTLRLATLRMSLPTSMWPSPPRSALS